MFLSAIFHQNCQAVLAFVSINGLMAEETWAPSEDYRLTQVTGNITSFPKRVSYPDPYAVMVRSKPSLRNALDRSAIEAGQTQ